MRGTRLVLSDVMPILENAGLRVLSMSPFEATENDGAGVHLRVRRAGRAHAADRPRCARRAARRALLAVGTGETTNDALNALVLDAGLAWREVDVLRAYCEYAFQLKLAPSAYRADRRTARAPVRRAAAGRDVRPEVRPGRGTRASRKRQARLDALCSEFMASLENVTSLADDRALRHLLALLDATVRTNYFLHGGARRPRGPAACRTSRSRS
jgi:glutamate dehydrogenase